MKKVVHRTSHNGWETLCSKKVGILKYSRDQRVMTKPHTPQKQQEVLNSEHLVLCDDCWYTYNELSG